MTDPHADLRWWAARAEWLSDPDLADLSHRIRRLLADYDALCGLVREMWEDTDTWDSGNLCRSGRGCDGWWCDTCHPKEPTDE